jgi:hypothetical protein
VFLHKGEHLVRVLVHDVVSPGNRPEGDAVGEPARHGTARRTLTTIIDDDRSAGKATTR